LLAPIDPSAVAVLIPRFQNLLEGNLTSFKLYWKP
jgi:hypothetical protein